MRILVTGCAGFLASNVCEKLLEQNHLVFGVDNLAFGSVENIPENLEWIQRDFSTLPEAFFDTYDVLLHCATTNLIFSATNPVETVNNNALKTIQLFNRFRRKIVNISTASVYGNSKIIPTKESGEIICTTAYETSKRIVELHLHQRGNFTTIRPENIYGKNQRPSLYSGVISKMIQSVLDDEPIKINGDGLSTRTYTHVDDVVDSIVKTTVDVPSLNCELNISGGDEVDALTLAKTISELMDKPLRVDFIPSRSIDTISRRKLDTTKAEKLLNWQPQISLIEGLKRTISWQKKEYSVQAVPNGG